MFFPFFFNQRQKEFFVIPKDNYINIYNKDTDSFNDAYLNDVIKSYTDKGYYAILPNSGKGEFLRWRWGYDSCVKGISNGTFILQKSKGWLCCISI